MEKYLLYSKGLNKFLTYDKDLSEKQEEARLYTNIGDAISDASKLNQNMKSGNNYFRVFSVEINN